MKRVGVEFCGRQSVPGPGTSVFPPVNDSLRTWRSGGRIPVEARFSASFQTHTVAQPASYVMGTVSFLGGKVAGVWRLPPPPPSSTEVEGSVEVYICSASGPSWPVLGWPLPLVPFNQSSTLIFINTTTQYKTVKLHVALCSSENQGIVGRKTIFWSFSEGLRRKQICTRK